MCGEIYLAQKKKREAYVAFEKAVELGVPRPQLQDKLKSDNAQLVRPLMFCSRKYNMHLTPCSLLVEFGTDANTLAEAVYSAELFADSLSEFLKEYEE